MAAEAQLGQRLLPRLSARASDRWAALAFVGPTVAILAAIVAFPLVYVVWVSLHDWFLFDEVHEFVGGANYWDWLRSAQFWTSVKLMFIYSSVALTAELVIGFVLATLMFTKLPGVGFFRTLFVTPVILAPLVVGLMWRLIMEPSYGVLNYLLRQIGIEGPAWTADPSVAIFAITAVDVWQWTPFVFLVLLAGLHAIPAPIEEAAELDGAGIVRKSLYITLPLLKRVIIIVVLLRGIDLLRSFDLIFALTRGGPGESSQTLPYLTWNQGFQLFEVGKASTLAIFVVLIISVVVFFAMRAFRRTLEAR